MPSGSEVIIYLELGKVRPISFIYSRPFQQLLYKWFIGKGSCLLFSEELERSALSQLSLEKKKGKIFQMKNILNVRRSSKRDKSKGKKGEGSSSSKVPSSAPYNATTAPPLSALPKRTFQSTPTQSSVESSLCGHYEVTKRKKKKTEEKIIPGERYRCWDSI